VLCICAAILNAVTHLLNGGHLAIFTDNINTVQLFNSLAALRNFNWMLIKVVDVIIASNIDFRVFHVPGPIMLLPTPYPGCRMQMFSPLTQRPSSQPFNPLK